MESTLEGVRKDYQIILSLNSTKKDTDEFSNNVIKEGLESKNEMMTDTLKRLCDTIEELGNYLDGHDIVCAIDQRVYDTPLDILLHGKRAIKDFKKSLNKYRTGSEKEWEGDGYFIKPVYTYDGEKYY